MISNNVLNKHKLNLEGRLNQHEILSSNIALEQFSNICNTTNHKMVIIGSYAWNLLLGITNEPKDIDVKTQFHGTTVDHMISFFQNFFTSEWFFDIEENKKTHRLNQNKRVYHSQLPYILLHNPSASRIDVIPFNTNEDMVYFSNPIKITHQEVNIVTAPLNTLIINRILVPRIYKLKNLIGYNRQTVALLTKTQNSKFATEIDFTYLREKLKEMDLEDSWNNILQQVKIFNNSENIV